MTDRVPGAPGQYKFTVSAAEAQKILTGETVTVTLIRDDQPQVPGTPYNKAAVLPDDLAAIICPDAADPTPADALRGLLPKRGGIMTGDINMGNRKVTGLSNPVNESDAATKQYADSLSYRKLLYTNPNPASDFSPKEISIPGLSNYADIFVVCAMHKDHPTTFATGHFDAATTGTYNINIAGIAGLVDGMFRSFTIAADKIAIGDCYSTSGKNNSGMIPVKIYGQMIRNAT